MRTLARTWHSGQTPLNIFVLGALLAGAVIPLVWSMLPHHGTSCTAARILLVARLLKVLPARRWAVVIADREFMGGKWCAFLRWNRGGGTLNWRAADPEGQRGDNANDATPCSKVTPDPRDGVP